MTRTEHLNAIVAECRELLATAEVASLDQLRETPDGDCEYFGDTLIMLADRYEGWQNDVAFIAACAGNAEAGWRATIAAIDGLREIMRSGVSADPYEACSHQDEANEALDAIIAAWPVERLGVGDEV